MLEISFAPCDMDYHIEWKEEKKLWHSRIKEEKHYMCGARYTWTNRQASPTQSVLDRVLVSPDWDLRFSLASLHAITRIGSDHVPLLLSSADERPPIPLVSALRLSGSPSMDLPTPSALGGSRLGPTPTLAPLLLLTRGTSVRSMAGNL